ncbi:uncharacterized protein, partial [Montipora foliosa]|uniref:uncharacterized protein n=1 Tax=Montipora foliosa TaxID=591990 RepID=UPI0035F146A8
LGLNGINRQFTLTTLSNTEEQSGLEVGLKVSSIDGAKDLCLPRVWSVERIPVSEKSIPVPDDLKRWPHLQDLSFPQIDDQTVILLIGGDCPRAFWVLHERKGASDEPYAVKFPLGWTLLGPVGPTSPHEEFHVNFVRFLNDDELLQSQVKMFWLTDFGESLAASEVCMSLEDKRALKIMNETVTKTDGHYQVRLPWRNRPPSIPNNRSFAESRLCSLKRRLVKDEELHRKYNTTMDENLSKGHAVKIPPRELSVEGKIVWYLPHHPVVHTMARKPDKVRVVFDCAAKYMGTSLNDQLMQGPDLNNNLIGVLMRFRQEKSAIIADIESMFHQARVDPRDLDALRFLWWPSEELHSSPAEYKMAVHVFGATSSPSCACFCLLRTAEDNKDTFPSEISVRTPHDARLLVKMLTELLSRGGFSLTKWMSNDREVLASIPPSRRAKSVVNLDFDEMLTEHALGVEWRVRTDEFCFKVIAKERPPTRRGILSVASSVVSEVDSAGVMQEEDCWGEKVESQALSDWKDWLAALC